MTARAVMTWCMRCGSPDCERCTRCGACSEPGCACEPAPTSALGHEGSCEHCHRLVDVGERVLVYGDHVVVHVDCPAGRQRARA